MKIIRCGHFVPKKIFYDFRCDCWGTGAWFSSKPILFGSVDPLSVWSYSWKNNIERALK